jgi:hypothetical protein
VTQSGQQIAAAQSPWVSQTSLFAPDLSSWGRGRTFLVIVNVPGHTDGLFARRAMRQDSRGPAFSQPSVNLAVGLDVEERHDSSFSFALM